MPGSFLLQSVGLAGANRPPDVTLVQKMLNAIPVPRGGPMPALVVDGLCGPLTCNGIRRFQIANGGYPDARIDPGYGTEQALVAILSAMGQLAAIVGNAAAAAAGSPVASPAARGPDTPIRQRFMAICAELLPPLGGMTAGSSAPAPAKPGGAKPTGCGEFPGRVFTRVPVIPPQLPGAFKAKLYGKNVYLTSPITQWEEYAQAIDKQYGVQTWVPFTTNRPLPGDIYVLGKHENRSAFQHVGVMVKAEGSEWITADGGQGGGWQSGYTRRKFDPSGLMDGEAGKKAWLRGWVDLDAIFAVAMAAFPQNL